MSIGTERLRDLRDCFKCWSFRDEVLGLVAEAADALSELLALRELAGTDDVRGLIEAYRWLDSAECGAVESHSTHYRVRRHGEPEWFTGMSLLAAAEAAKEKGAKA